MTDRVQSSGGDQQDAIATHLPEFDPAWRSVDSGGAQIRWRSAARRLQNVRRMAFRLARIVALLLGVASVYACRCPPPDDEIFLLHMPDEATQALVDQCLQAHQCLPLCQKVAGPNATILHCEIHQQADPEFIEVHVGAESFCGA